MFKISAVSKYKNLNGDTRLYYVLGLASIVSILTFIVYRNFIITMVMMGCGIVAYIVLSRVPKTITIEMTDDLLNIGENEIDWKKCVGWSMEDLGDMLEVTVQTSEFVQPFVNFYFQPKQPGVKEFVLYLSQHCTYTKEIAEGNVILKFLRQFNLM
jgi:hypothetical protein